MAASSATPQPPRGWREIPWDDYTHTVTVEGGDTVSYVDIGEGEGSVMLLIHGLGGSWRVWLENIPALAATCRVIAVDLPGFGASPAPGGSCSFSAYARTLDRLCAALEITAVVAMGNSFGGWVAAELAVRHPDLVEKLVLVDAAGIPATRRERWKVVSMLKGADRMSPLGCRYRSVLSRHPRLRRRAFAFVVARGDRIAGDLAYHLLPETPSPVFRPLLSAAVRSWSVAWCDRVTEIESPALILWGEFDRQLPLRHGKEWAKLLPRSRLVVVPGTGHMPMLERPDVVNGHVAEFLSGLESRRAAQRRTGRAAPSTGEPLTPTAG